MGSAEQQGPAVPAAPVLPERQEDVLALSADTPSTAASAAVLGVSADTVKTHRRHLRKRLAAPTMTAAVHRYHAWWGLDPFLRARARLDRPGIVSGAELPGLDAQQRRIEQWLRRLGIATGPRPGESVANSTLRR